MEREKVISALNEFKKNSESHFNSMYQTMKTNFDFIKNFFTKENINKIEWNDIQKLGEHFYCKMTMELAKQNAFGKPNAEIESYRKIFTEMINDNISIKEKFDIFTKWNATKESSNYGKKQLGYAFLSELLAYLSEECFILNKRTWINLHYFFDNNEIEEKKQGIKDGNEYIEINGKIKEIEHLYNEIVGKQTEFPINIELDQFFSWFSERISKKENLSDENIETQNIKSVLEKFIIKSLEHFETGMGEGKSQKERITSYNNTDVFIGYGFGSVANTTYMAFIKYDQEIRNGIYPVILYNKASKILEVCYGESSEQKPKYKWNENFIYNLNTSKTKYKTSYVKNSFKIENKEDIKNNIDNIINDVNIVISDFHKNFSNVNDLARDEKSSEQTITLKNNQPLNQILYGPPGTGKTYNTVIKAMEIIDSPNKYDNIDDTKYKELKDRFNKLKESGQIEFITFHQSYSYEEFIEGIKPYIPKDNWINSNETSNDDLDEVKYIGKNGIFKNICENAKKLILKNVKLNLKEDPKIWKVSLEHTGDNETRKECMQNNHIRIGWDDYGEVITDETIFRNGGKNVLNAFINKMEKGDIVLSCYSEKTIDAIGIIEGDYEWHDKYPEYKRLRKVNWLIKGLNHNILDINKGIKFTLGTVYQLNNISLKDILDIINSNKKKIVDYEINNKPYVIIIDEINRGNISKIFGELITLIEEDKREQMSVKLPYSQDFFTVPKNLYIIGTMNTSDRSIASVDIALRRRFKFIEMMPKEDVVTDIIIENDKTFRDIFKALNEKITILLDRDHQIGHSYFLEEKINSNEENLKNIWFSEILPLLNEYFYNDWDKLQALLGEAELKKDNNDNYSSFIVKSDLSKYNMKDIDDEDKYIYNFVEKEKVDFKKALLKIVDIKQESK